MAEGRKEKDLELVEDFETVRAVTSDGKSVQVPKSKFGGNLEVATPDVLGGIKADPREATDTNEVKIDPTTGKLYCPPSEVAVATASKVGGIVAEPKTSDETGEVKIDSSTGKLYAPKGQGNPPDEEDITLAEINGVQKLQFNDKQYNASFYSGLGRQYLRKNTVDGVNILTQSMLSNSNTRYIIQYDYDLNGATITVPEGCVLDFQGGSFSNGVIKGTNTTLTGIPVVDGLNGSFSNLIKSSFSTKEAGYEKLKMLASLGINELEIDEDYTISTFSGSITSSIKKIRGNNVLLSVSCNTSTSNGNAYFLKLSNIDSISGFTFDFNSKEAAGAIYIKNSCSLKVSDISVNNIKSNREGVNSIFIDTTGNFATYIDNLLFDNISCIGNGSIGDSAGSCIGLYYRGLSLEADTYINNIVCRNIYNFDSSQSVIVEDAVGIYVSASSLTNSKSRMFIYNVTGYNYGKRLIKSDYRNIFIDNVVAESYDGVSLVVVGLNNQDSSSVINDAFVRNVTFKGITGFVVATAISNTHIDNVNAYSDATSKAVALFNISQLCQFTSINNIYGENLMFLAASGSAGGIVPVINATNIVMKRSQNGLYKYFTSSNIPFDININGFRYIVENDEYSITLNSQTTKGCIYNLENVYVEFNNVSNNYAICSLGVCEFSMSNFEIVYKNRGLFDLSFSKLVLNNGIIRRTGAGTTTRTTLGVMTVGSEYKCLKIKGVNYINESSDSDLCVGTITNNHSSFDFNAEIDRMYNDTFILNYADSNSSRILNKSSYLKSYYNRTSDFKNEEDSIMQYKFADKVYRNIRFKGGGWTFEGVPSMPTENRNSIGIVMATGTCIFDTTLNKPVYVKSVTTGDSGSASLTWVDATGTVV